MNPPPSTETAGKRTPSAASSPANSSATLCSRVLFNAGLLGAAGVALGAFGAHGLEPLLTQRGSAPTWETAVHYHLLHAVAMLALAACLHARAATSVKLFRWTARCWTFGTLLFSGSLYVLALGGPRWLGPITPLGGAALIAGWVLLCVAALKKRDL